MQRRRALQAVGSAVLPLAGCIETDATGTESDRTETGSPRTPSETHSEIGPETPAEDAAHELGDEVLVDGFGTVAVESVTVQRSVVHHHFWRSLYEPADAQLLVLAGRIPDDADPEFDVQFDVRIDGAVVDAVAETWLMTGDRIYAVSVPITTADEVALVLRAGERPAWALPGTVIETIADAPEFHLRDATIRERDDGVALDLTVENSGTRDGVFRGVVEHASAADADGAVRFPVSAGETVTETVRPAVLESWTATDEFAHEITATTRVFAVS